MNKYRIKYSYYRYGEVGIDAESYEEAEDLFWDYDLSDVYESDGDMEIDENELIEEGEDEEESLTEILIEDKKSFNKNQLNNL